METITRVVQMRVGEGAARDAHEFLGRWACAWCERDLGDTSGGRIPRRGQRCQCGAVVVEIEIVAGPAA